MSDKQKAFIFCTVLLCLYAIFVVRVDHENPQEVITLRTGKGVAYIIAETPDTPKKMNRGLMHREQLEKGKGMLFDLKTPQQISMWMKDTHIPLDMIFFGSDGKVLGVHKNAKPLDPSRIPTPPQTRAVLEVNAGFVKEWRVRVGDTLQATIFGNAPKIN